MDHFRLKHGTTSGVSVQIQCFRDRKDYYNFFLEKFYFKIWTWLRKGLLDNSLAKLRERLPEVE